MFVYLFLFCLHLCLGYFITSVLNLLTPIERDACGVAYIKRKRRTTNFQYRMSSGWL